MKNILSYQYPVTFSGKEIRDWANYQIQNNTSHKEQAERILKLYGDTIVSERKYRVLSSFETFGCAEIRHSPLIIKALENN